MKRDRIRTALALFVAFAAGLLTLRPAAWAYEQLTTTACNTTSAGCITGANSGKGPGILGTSKQGYGVQALSSAGTGLFVKNSSQLPAAYVQTSTGTGLLVTSKTGSAINATSSGTADTITARTLGGNFPVAIHGYNLADDGTAVRGDTYGGTGVEGFADPVGFGVAGVDSGNAPSGYPAGVIAEEYGKLNTAAAIMAYAPNGANLMLAPNNHFKIDGGGNVTTSGTFNSAIACTRGCDGTTRVNAYGTTAAVPTIEDDGEARLANGAAFVALDPAFANAIDLRSAYLVMLTPEGDTRGLYVGTRTAAGFAVRETMGGRSNIGFAYRIVAHPLGQARPRLPLVRVPASTQVPNLRTKPGS